MHTYLHTSIHAYRRGRHTYTPTCIHTYSTTHIHTYIHAYIHTARNINAYMQSYGQYKTIKNQYRTGKGMTIQDMAYNQTATQ